MPPDRQYAQPPEVGAPPAFARGAFEPRFRNAVELFAFAECERPDAPALIYHDTIISFREAGATARSLASALQQRLEVQPGDRVALMLQNVPQMPIAFHAVWLAGGVATPVNVMNKRRELVHQLNDCGVRVVICHESSHRLLQALTRETRIEHIITVCELDYLAHVPESLAKHRRLACPGALSFETLVREHRDGELVMSDPAPASPALITYTSGTTGQPKGAVGSHRAVAHNAEVWRRWYDLGPDDVIVGMAPLFHITGLMGHMAAARAATGPLVLGFRFEPGEMLTLIERWRGTFAVGSITAFIALLDHADFADRDLSSLRVVATGGAPVAPTVVERFEQACGLYIHNTYGLTETTSTAILVPYGTRAPVDLDDGALAVGIPVYGAEARIVGLESGVELGPGELGELLIRGPMVMTEYWDDSDATALAIREGWLWTGDVARRDAAGWFWIVDRVKDVIIASGFKVWPREVEDVLYGHPAVAEACVVGVPDAYRGETVHAYVVPRRGTVVDAAQIIEYCRATLAVYKAPRHVYIVEALPKTASGKMLRRELRVMARRVDAAGGPHGPRD